MELVAALRAEACSSSIGHEEGKERAWVCPLLGDVFIKSELVKERNQILKNIP
jgi:hypothetical protein